MSAEVHELVSLAHNLRRQNRLAEARDAAERALRMAPDNAAAWFNLGAALGGLGELDAAETAYRRALERNPRYAEAWSNLGGILGGRGDAEAQLSAYENALEANPQLAPVWSNFGNALCNAGKFAAAERACRSAVELDAGCVAGWVNLGRALHEMKRAAEAEAACRRAVDLAPELADAWAGLGNALMARREFAAAIQAYTSAVALRPEGSEFHTNLGIALKRIGAELDGDAALRKALELDPANDFASWNLATSLLERGQFVEGWERYEARWKRPDAPARRFRLKGGPPSAGRALLWGEQGVGDHILYACMAADVAEGGAAVTLECDARLAALFRRSFPTLAVVPQTDPPQVDPELFDHVLPLGSLGRFLRPSLAAFPERRGYLVADAARARRYRETLSREADHLVVGIAWRSGNPELGNEKSAPLKEWGPVLTVAGVSFVSLQYGDVGEECREAERAFGTEITRLAEPDPFSDLDGLAALESACDIVITTSTINAHLTGALGLPGWVLLPRRIGTLWYWLEERADSPWYPSLSLIRQSTDGDWASVMDCAAEKLRDMLAGRR